MNFGQAIEFLKRGNQLARRGWNGKGMFIYLVDGARVPLENLRNAATKAFDFDNEFNRGSVITINSHIDMKAEDGSIVVGWLASQTDMLAEDWEVIR